MRTLLLLSVCLLLIPVPSTAAVAAPTAPAAAHVDSAPAAQLVRTLDLGEAFVWRMQRTLAADTTLQPEAKALAEATYAGIDRDALDAELVASLPALMGPAAIARVNADLQTENGRAFAALFARLLTGDASESLIAEMQRLNAYLDQDAWRQMVDALKDPGLVARVDAVVRQQACHEIRRRHPDRFDLAGFCPAADAAAQ